MENVRDVLSTRYLCTPVYFWAAPRETSGRIRTRLRTPHPCHVPRVRGVRGASHPTNGGAEAGAGHSNRCLSMPLPNSTGPLFPVLESGMPGSRRGHTHTHTHMGWNIAASCLGCSQGGRRIGWPLLRGAYKWCTQLQPRSHRAYCAYLISDLDWSQRIRSDTPQDCLCLRRVCLYAAPWPHQDCEFTISLCPL